MDDFWDALKKLFQNILQIGHEWIYLIHIIDIKAWNQTIKTNALTHILVELMINIIPNPLKKEWINWIESKQITILKIQHFRFKKLEKNYQIYKYLKRKQLSKKINQ